jgi:hypothetical protein
MNWIVRYMKGIMLVSGLLTCTIFYAAIAPDAILRSIFGDTLQGPVAEIVVRHWGALIGLMGAMLVYGAFSTAARSLVLTIAGLNKLIFIALMLSFGRPFLDHQAGVAVISDLVQVALFVGYLIAARGPRRAAV